MNKKLKKASRTGFCNRVGKIVRVGSIELLLLLLLIILLGITMQIVVHFLDLVIQKVNFLAHSFALKVLADHKLLHLIAQQFHLRDYTVKQSHPLDAHLLVCVHKFIANELHVLVTCSQI